MLDVRTCSLVAVVIVSLALTGCLGLGEPTLQEEATPVPEPATQRGDPTIERSPVETRQDGDRWIAVQGINITNGLGGATDVTYTLQAPAGGLSADHDEGRPVGDLQPGTGYWTQITLRSTASTEEQARRGVASMRLVHEDELSGDQLDLRTEVQLPEDDPSNATDVSPEGLLGSTATQRSARLQVHVPQGPHYTVDAQTRSGGISVAGAFPTVSAEAQSGGVSLAIQPWTSGSLSAATQSGGVSVKLFGGADNGYDVEAHADTGGVSVSIPNAEPVGEQSRTHAHVRTIGFSSKPIQTTVDASTQSGGVSVQAS